MDKSIENIFNLVETFEEGKYKKKKKAKGKNKKRADHKHEYVLIPFSPNDLKHPCVTYAQVCKCCGYIHNIFFFKNEKDISDFPVIKNKVYYGSSSDKFLPDFKEGMFEC